MSVLHEEAVRRISNIAGALSSEPDDKWLELNRRCSPQRILRGLMDERPPTGADGEVSSELDRRRPRTMPNSAYVSFETLAWLKHQRDAARAATVGGAGGALTATVNFPAAAFNPLSLLIGGYLGWTYFRSTAPINMPRVTSDASTYWLSTETTSVPETDQGFGQLSLSPHTVGGVTELSRQLVLQSSPDATDVVAVDLTRKISRAIESAVFAGSGVAGTPKGVLNTTGVGVISGTTFALSTVAGAVSGVGDALSPDAAPGWAAAKSTAILLRQRPEFANTGYRTLWEGPATVGALGSYPAAASSGVPSASAIFGCWKYLYLCDFSGGIELALNPFGGNVSGGGSDAQNFQRGIISVRALATLDVGVVWPSAFAAVTGIT